MKFISKGCRNYWNMILLYKELWWNLDWYFIDHLSSFWETQCLGVERNHLFLNFFIFLMLLFHKSINASSGFQESNQIYLIGLEFYLRAIFIRWRFISESKFFIFNVFLWEIIWFHLLFSLELYQLFFWLFKHLIIFIKLGLKFGIKEVFRR